MSAKSTSPAEALNLLMHNAEDVRVLAKDQRKIADMQHATAHKLEELSTSLKEEAKHLQAEFKKAETDSDAAAVTRSTARA